MNKRRININYQGSDFRSHIVIGLQYTYPYIYPTHSFSLGIDQNKSGWRLKLPIPRLDETTVIHRMFGGYLRSQIHCTSCGYKSNTYDPFLDLSLEVHAANSVRAALEQFTQRERLDKANRWKCSSCHKHVCARKQLTVFRPSLSLIVHLKRFSFGGDGGGGYSNFHYRGGGYGGGSKITKPIQFPAHLSLPLSDGRKCEYTLTGVILHVGYSASSGHYTAYVKKPRSEKWLHLDDSHVSVTTESNVLKTKDAYVLFYCRKEVKLELPLPPPRQSVSNENPSQQIHDEREPCKNSTSSSTSKSILETKPLVQKQILQKQSSKIEQSSESSEEDSDSDSSSDAKPKDPQTACSKLSSSNNARADDSIDSDSDSDSSYQIGESSDEASSESSQEEEMEETSIDSSSVSENDELPKKHRSEKGFAKVSQMQAPNGTKSNDIDKAIPNDADSVSSSEGSSSSESDTNKKPKNSNVHSQSKDEDSSNSSSSSDSDSTGNSSSEDSSSDDSSDEKETNSSITSSGKSNMKILQTNKTSKLKIEESSSDSDSGTSSSSEESSSSQNDKKSLQVLPKNSLTPKTVSNTASTKNDSKRATIRVNSSTGNKIEVSLNNIRQKRSPWNRNGNNDSSRGQNTLLGNKNVGRWDDDEEDGNENLQNKKTTDLREALSKQMDKNDRRRKRGMYLNSWDAALDAGKVRTTKPLCHFILGIKGVDIQYFPLFLLLLFFSEKESQSEGSR